MGLPYLFVLQRRVDGNKSKVGFEKYHHAWKSFTFTVWFIEVSCSLLFSWNYWSALPKTHQNAIANRPNLNSRGLVNRKFGKKSGKSDMGSLESQWSWKSRLQRVRWSTAGGGEWPGMRWVERMESVRWGRLRFVWKIHSLGNWNTAPNLFLEQNKPPACTVSASAVSETDSASSACKEHRPRAKSNNCARAKYSGYSATQPWLIQAPNNTSGLKLGKWLGSVSCDELEIQCYMSGLMRWTGERPRLAWKIMHLANGWPHHIRD